LLEPALGIRDRGHSNVCVKQATNLLRLCWSRHWGLEIGGTAMCVSNQATNLLRLCWSRHWGLEIGGTAMCVSTCLYQTCSCRYNGLFQLTTPLARLIYLTDWATLHLSVQRSQLCLSNVHSCNIQFELLANTTPLNVVHD